MYAARTRRRNLELASVTLCSPRGWDVTIHATIHVADKRFYARLAAELAAAEKDGAQVLYEGVKKSEPASWIEERRVNELANLKGTYRDLADVLGLAVQHVDALPVQDTWVNTDYTDVQLVRELPDVDRFLRTLREGRGAVQKVIDHADDETTNLVGATLRRLPALTAVIGILDTVSLRRRKWKTVLIGRRNKVAADAIETANRNGHHTVHALWGAAHVPGIVSLLEARGYTVTTTRWFPAIVVDTHTDCEDCGS